MVQIIADHINECIEMGGMGYLTIADELLEKIQNHGMKCPFNNALFYNTWRSGGDGYEWEDEQYD